MLKQVPKVGDVVIAKDLPSVRAMGGMSPGREYTIERISPEGDAIFYDNDEDARPIGPGRLSRFDLKVVPQPSVGFIEINREYDFLIGKTRVVLDVDADGLASVKALAEKSVGAKARAEIVDKIAQCQAEMDHLNVLLAEASE